MKRRKILMQLVLLLGVSYGNATTIQTLSLEQRTLRSDRVVVAEVQSVHFEKAVDAKRIYTLTKLKVIDSLKGNAKKDMVLTIRQIGGQIGEWTQYVPGDAKFKIGEEVLVFLRHDQRDDLHFLVGMSQGKIVVDLGTDQIGTSLGAQKTHGLHIHKPALKDAHHDSPTLSGLRAMIRQWTSRQSP